MKFVRTHWFVFLLTIIILIVFTFELLLNAYRKKHVQAPSANKEAVSER